jgi:hypothetical protein
MDAGFALALVQDEKDPENFEYGDLYHCDLQGKITDQVDEYHTFQICAWLEEYRAGEMSQKWEAFKLTEEFRPRNFQYDLEDYTGVSRG